MEWIELCWPDRIIEPSSLSVHYGQDLLSTWQMAELMARLSRLAVIVIPSGLVVLVVGIRLAKRLKRNEDSTAWLSLFSGRAA